MADIDKVIKWLEHCTSYGTTCEQCDYWEYNVEDDTQCGDVLMRDALELLKAQQPKEPMQLKYSETREEYWFYESICPKCGNRWISNGTDHFCPTCGQPVFEPCEEEQKDGEQE